jgi:co-chaperonin GroES (HSP10)
MLKIKAVGHRVIIKADPVEEVSKGGIVLSVDTKREAAAAQKGTVYEIGSMAWKNELYGFGKEGWEPWCKVEDRVYFARYSGKLIKDTENGVETIYFVINDEDVQCVILAEGTEGDRDDD